MLLMMPTRLRIRENHLNKIHQKRAVVPRMSDIWIAQESHNGISEVSGVFF